MEGGPGRKPPGRILYRRVTLAALLSRAYAVSSDQVTGLDWLSDRSYVFTIVATMPANTSPAQFQLMLQNLLAERFHVSLRHETQTRPGYELIVAKGGSKLKEWNPERDAAGSQPDTGATAPATGRDEEGFRPLPPGLPPGVANVASMVTDDHGVTWWAWRGSLDGWCSGLGNAVNQSSGDDTLGHPRARVVNKTGLTGVYEIRLKYGDWTKSPAGSSSPQAGAEAPIAAASDPSADAPDIFTALEKQLGLKLQKGAGVNVEVLVVDHADKVPIEN